MVNVALDVDDIGDWTNIKNTHQPFHLGGDRGEFAVVVAMSGETEPDT